MILGVGSLIVVVPALVVLCLISAVRFRCNPLFVQRRHGVGEEVFPVVKIRSLPKSFPHRHGKHDLDDHTFEGWSKFLRQTHLDELPQVFNVISGSMSIVGPRPMISEVIEKLEPHDRAVRAMVKPGLTGPWQMSTMGSVSLHDCPELDNAYVEHASFMADSRLISMTAASMFGRPGPGAAGPAPPSSLVSRIVLNDFAGHAFMVDLAAALQRAGNDVVYAYCDTNLSPHGKFDAVTVPVQAISTRRPSRSTACSGA